MIIKGVTEAYIDNNYPVKAGVNLRGGNLLALTKNRLLVPISHPDAVVFIGYVSTQYEEGMYDNTNGEDGDIKVRPIQGGDVTFMADALVKPLDVTIVNIGQTIFASNHDALHLSPGEGRFPIGILKDIAPAAQWSIPVGGDANAIYYQLSLNTLPVFYS
ncbi:hypothetical protein [Bartonella sp. HY406]|uniref:hypothetical protein n=1 Tax=Bartonella sp. HY406 TaxID=2979331 RepID=UPI0021C58288|nr:hypothetical protein [Bartonella sp. HY406]UXN03864.1 hypothetical protein N6B01_02145 [Bartonella sp. HY406]